MTPDRPVMFRAGRGALPAGVSARLALLHFTDDFVLLADISEFQPQITDAAYLAWSEAVIIRAMYGARHDDKAWFGGQRRDLLHAGGVKFLGIYAYITAAEDPAVQARALTRLIRQLRPGEKIIGDLEEGSGSQLARWSAWAGQVHADLGDFPWSYSGLNFAASHGLAPVDWVAAYGQTEPSPPHQLWQFTDAFTIPGIPGPCDCSVFHGTIGQLAALAWQPAMVPPAVPQPVTTEENMIVLGMLASGGPAVVLPVPAGKTRVTFYADPGYKGLVHPELRVIFNVGATLTASPVWGIPAVVSVPQGGTRLSVARLDDGNVPVTAEFA